MSDDVRASSPPSTKNPRRKVTRELMVKAGIALTLPKVTVKAIAAELGVSIVAVYNHLDNVSELRMLVAEEILDRWDYTMPTESDTLEEALLALGNELRAVVHENPGIAQYLIDIDAKSTSALARIDEIEGRFATVFGLKPTQAMWAVSTVALHAIALAEMVYAPRRPPDNDAMLARTDLNLIPQALTARKSNHESDFEWSMRAVIIGVSTVIDHPRFDTY